MIFLTYLVRKINKNSRKTYRFFNLFTNFAAKIDTYARNKRNDRI